VAVEELLQNNISLEQFDEKLEDIAPKVVLAVQPKSNHLETNMLHTTSGYP